MVKYGKYTILFLFIIILLNDSIILAYASFPNNKSLSKTKIYYFYEEGIIANGGNDILKLNQTDRYYELLMNSSFQKSFLINASHNIVNFFYDEDGAPIIELDLPKEILPKKYIKYYVTQKIEIYESFSLNEDISFEKSGSFSDIMNTYYKINLFSKTTAPIGIWKYNDSNWYYLIEKAKELKGNEENVLKIVCSFINWIGNNVEYPENGSEMPKYPNETITLENIKKNIKGEGDCDDQANLLILLCRAIGIPAFLQTGGIALYKEKYKNFETSWNGHLNFYYGYVGWHAWAMVYIPPWGWLPVDLTWGYYGLGKKDPLTAIKYSAKALQEIIYLRDYYTIDYIKDTKEFRKIVEDKNLYVYAYYLVIPEGKSIIEEMNAFPPKYTFPWMNKSTNKIPETFISTMTTTTIQTVTSQPIIFTFIGLTIIAIAFLVLLAYILTRKS